MRVNKEELKLIRDLNEMRGENLKLKDELDRRDRCDRSVVEELRQRIDENRRILLGITETERTGAADRIQ